THPHTDTVAHSAEFGCVLLAFSSRACIFFFHSSGAHRDLHSFPTRRSSDLSQSTSAITAASACLSELNDANFAASHGGKTFAQRSEEHTSELQSRGHLVCRLLLEKKKKPNSPSPLQHRLCQPGTCATAPRDQ